MTLNFPPTRSNDTLPTRVPLATAAATITTTVTVTRGALTMQSFDLSTASIASVPASPLSRVQLTNSSVADLGARVSSLVGGNFQQQLTTLLHDLRPTSTDAPAIASSSTAHICSGNAATATTARTRLLAAIAPLQTTTATALAIPAAPTIVASATGATATTLTTFTAILPTATTNAFIQMNSTNFADCTGSGGGGSGTAIVSAATSASNATDAPAVDSYLVGMAWPKALIVAVFLLLILVTVVGNTLVILSVLTTRRLRTVTNCFVMNLAITDWLVGTCVMPPAVILYIVGSWHFGWILCDIWISLDVLLCTGSILSLCAISLDRYLAVTQPLTYSKKRRSKRLALFMILIVWVMALSITCPPYLGWYEPGRRQEGYAVCRYNQNKGYVVFSAMGSFFIPLAVMLYVYLKIGYVLTSRRQRMVRDANTERTADHEIDCDNFISESEHFQCATPKFPSFKTRWGNTSNGTGHCNDKTFSLHCSNCNKSYISDAGGLRHQASFYELMEISRLTSLIQCSSISCKYSGTCLHSATAMGIALGDRRASTLPIQVLHYTESGASFSETCLSAATTTSAINTTPSIKFNHGCPHQAAQSAAHHQHSHHPHRIPMRVSTTKRDTKTAKTLTIVMGGFIACWLPFFVYYLLIPFLPPAAVFEGLMSFLTWVGWVNCAINPFIYAFYNPDFRTAFWRLTCRRICKQKPPPNHLAMFRG